MQKVFFSGFIANPQGQHRGVRFLYRSKSFGRTSGNRVGRVASGDGPFDKVSASRYFLGLTARSVCIQRCSRPALNCVSGRENREKVRLSGFSLETTGPEFEYQVSSCEVTCGQFQADCCPLCYR
jgi:hypothetical protein